MNGKILADERVLTSMVKYSLGRMTYAPSMIQLEIYLNMKRISERELLTIKNLIENCNCYGQEDVDDIGWKRLLKSINKELSIRKSKLYIESDENKLLINEDVLGFAIRHGLKSLDNDYKMLIEECKSNIDLLSKKNICFILRDIDDSYIYGTKEEHKKEWLKLREVLSKKINKEICSVEDKSF